MDEDVELEEKIYRENSKGGEQCWLLGLDPCVSCNFRIHFSSTESGNKETSDLVGETCTKSDILFSKTSLLSNSISGLSEDRKHRSVLKQSTIEEAVLRAEIALVVLFQDLNPFWNLFTYNSSILWASIPVHISLHFEELFFCKNSFCASATVVKGGRSAHSCVYVNTMNWILSGKLWSLQKREYCLLMLYFFLLFKRFF